MYNLGKFDAKFDIGILLGYSTNGKAYRVYNTRTNMVEESVHVKFDYMISPPRKVVIDDVGEPKKSEDHSLQKHFEELNDNQQ